MSAAAERLRYLAGARFRGRVVAVDGRVVASTAEVDSRPLRGVRRDCSLCKGGECFCPERRVCRVCGQEREVTPEGRMEEHRIVRVRCTGSGQFVARWDALNARRLVEQLAAAWGADL